MLPLEGRRVGVTAARKAAEQITLIERRGATTIWAPALSVDPYRVDVEALTRQTDEVLSRPVDLLLGTTGIGMRTWFRTLEAEGTLEPLLAHLTGVETIARGPKTVGALRQRGLREDWVAPGEELAEMLEHLAGHELTGKRVVLQEWGQPLDDAATHLRSRGAEVVVVTIYRLEGTDDVGPLRALVAETAARTVDAVTFTSPPAVRGFMAVAESDGIEGAVVDAFARDVVALCVGPVTAAGFEPWAVPTVHPERTRLAAMVKHLEVALAPTSP